MRLDIAKEFSPIPIGQRRTDGERNAERFREDFLLPKIKRAIGEGEVLDVDFSGLAGLDVSFMNEAFGGLVRDHHLPPDAVLKAMRFVSDHSYLDPLFEHLREVIKNGGNRGGAV